MHFLRSFYSPFFQNIQNLYSYQQLCIRLHPLNPHWPLLFILLKVHFSLMFNNDEHVGKIVSKDFFFLMRTKGEKSSLSFILSPTHTHTKRKIQSYSQNISYCNIRIMWMKNIWCYLKWKILSKVLGIIVIDFWKETNIFENLRFSQTFWGI